MNLSLSSLLFVLSLAIRNCESTDVQIQSVTRNMQSLATSDDGKEYRIKSFLSSSADIEWCVELLRTTETIVLNECKERRSQVWTFDEYGRMKAAIRRAGCVYANTTSTTANVTESTTLSYEVCGEPEETNVFSYNLFDSTFSNMFGFLSVIDDQPIQKDELLLIGRDLCLVGQQWILEEELPRNLIKFAGNPCSETEGGCPLCTGDCDRDKDCAEGLRCAKRAGGYQGRENVPGCSYDSPNDPERFYDFDVCFEPKELPGIVNYVGSCDPHTYLCNECEGDCHNDHDCADGLKCFYRSAFEGVPGCSGEGGGRDVYAKNICYNSTKDIANVRWGNKCRVSNTCDVCTGNCTSDDDCTGDLRCAHREKGVEVPGCQFKRGDLWLRDRREHNYCFMPEVFPGNAGIVNYVGECGSDTYLCKRCEGNCDTNDDCEGKLECRHRDAHEHVPGCFNSGGRIDMKGKNICIDANWTKPELRPCPMFARKCPECAQCHKDSDCYGHLRCAIRVGIEDVPGCRWGNNKASMSDFYHGTNYCFMPQNKTGEVNYVGECGRRDGGYLCGECEGNCKYDLDCKPGLKCMYRSSFEEVPGCTEAGGERDMYGKGICFDPNFVEPTLTADTCTDFGVV